MAEDEIDVAPEERSGTWRRGWASAGAIVATIALILLVVMVTFSNRARDEALQWERHTYDVMLLTRTVDATMARSEAALGRYVLDEEQATGTIYYNEWRRAGRQIGQLHRLVRSPEQRELVEELRRLYEARGQELAAAARAAASKQDSGGVPLFYQAGMTQTGPALRSKLDQIAANEQENLVERMAQTRMFDEEADKFTEWLGWLAVLIGGAAIVLGLLAYRALAERLIARREADSESSRAMALEHAVQERTRELRDANDRLRAEAAERAAAEAQLRQVQKMEAVGQLTGGIAHDFNNMLAVIVGGLDLAKRKLSGPKREVEFHLDNAMEGATRAAALTRRLLAFARSEALEPQGTAPAELIENMLDLVDRSIGERVTVRTRFAEEPWRVWADPNLLENAILNLCVNARDAMEGEGELGIAIDNVVLGPGEVGELEPGDYVRISVSDTGHGIAPEHLERVFEPFFTTKPVGKGTGLGLSQIFGFARQSGGDVTIDSTQNVGTTVAIYLPRSTRVEEERVETAPVPKRDEPAAAAAGTTILVVEDDPRVSRSTVGALEELGYSPIACGSGREALEILEKNRDIELLITDVMMPEMTGPELVRIVAERYPEIAVLFVTGFVGEAGEADELTGHDLLRKPFTVLALSDAVTAARARRVSGSHPASATAAAE
ncbi:ATP-binding protein [Sphingosinicella humi]|uniref:histidine kinase n=1 Tax=Allosphingosinicella humi TaxID=2068657 RepID=A0A2U2J0R2_9SPHN|nr:ATP-binding protein [Sphingosinicella humi]PWG01930.1 histidine kinase [Sphingosinicella humi]